MFDRVPIRCLTSDEGRIMSFNEGQTGEVVSKDISHVRGVDNSGIVMFEYKLVCFPFAV